MKDSRGHMWGKEGRVQMKIVAGLGSVDEYIPMWKQEQTSFLRLCALFMDKKIRDASAA